MSRKDSKDRGLFERPPGSGIWWIRYYDAQGKDHREKVGPKGLAKQVYAKRKTQIREGQFFPQSLLRRRSILLAEFITDYLVEVKANHRSYRYDVSHARLWTATFGTVAIDELTANDLEKWKRERMSVRANATVVRELAWLKRLYNVAIRDEKIEKNPVAKIQFPKVNNARIRYLTDAEEISLRAVMDPIDFEAVEVALK